MECTAVKNGHHRLTRPDRKRAISRINQNQILNIEDKENVARREVDSPARSRPQPVVAHLKFRNMNTSI